MEIIHVVLGKANPERMNGVNKVVNELATRQTDAGHHAEVWGISKSTVHDYPERNYRTRLFPAMKFPFRLSKELIEAVINLPNDAVLHLHGGFLPQMYSLSRLLKDLHIPFVFTPHGSYNTIAMRRNKMVKHIYRMLFEKRMLRNARTIHVLGESEAAGLRYWMKDARVVRIPYGFEAEHGNQQHKPSGAPFIIGYCGRIDIHTKGLDALIEGFSLFHQQYPDSELRILGDGKEMPELQQMKEHSKAGSHIFLYGARYGAEKNELLQSFDVFAHPSRNEGLPSAVLEAAAIGIPCLVSRATNTGDAVEQYHAGAVIEGTDARQVSDALKQLYASIRIEHKASELSNSARRMIGEAFNWDQLLQAYQRMYLKAFA